MNEYVLLTFEIVGMLGDGKNSTEEFFDSINIVIHDNW